MLMTCSQMRARQWQTEDEVLERLSTETGNIEVGHSDIEVKVVVRFLTRLALVKCSQSAMTMTCVVTPQNEDSTEQDGTEERAR